MNSAHGDPLQGLRDIHLPAPVSFWPPAPGWWILALLIVVLLIAGIWWWRRWQGRAYQRSALKQLHALQSRLHAGEAESHIIADLSILLRRAAMTRYGREQVASLQGKAWLEFLDRTGRHSTFASEGQALLDAPYRKQTTQQATPLIHLAQRWLQVQA